MKRQAPAPTRRALLGTAGGTALLAAAAALPGAAAAPAAPAAARPGPQRVGYHETERIRTYYRLARY